MLGKRLASLSANAVAQRHRLVFPSHSPSSRFFATMSGPVQQTIESKLAEALKPTELHVINESYMHAVPKNSETHFKVVVVSPAFEGLKLIARHR
jgi:acid stress-induced BolA-like protein IbaG/YrbA